MKQEWLLHEEAGLYLQFNVWVSLPAGISMEPAQEIPKGWICCNLGRELKSRREGTCSKECLHVREPLIGTGFKPGGEPVCSGWHPGSEGLWVPLQGKGRGRRCCREEGGGRMRFSV